MKTVGLNTDHRFCDDLFEVGITELAGGGRGEQTTGARHWLYDYSFHSSANNADHPEPRKI